MSSPVLLFAGHAATLLAWSLLFQEGAARCGAGLLPLLRWRRRGALGLAGAGALLGWGAFSSALLGLATVGLFRPGPIIAVAVACVLASPGALTPRLLWWDAARELWSPAWPWWVAFLLGLSPVLLATMTPGMDQDSLVYHIGAAWQWLQAGRFFSGATAISTLTPLHADLCNILPILLDDPRLCKCLVVGSLVCGSAFWAARCLERGRPTAAWTGPLLAIASSYVLMLLNSGKNDVPACMCFLVGACLTLEGAWVAGVAFLGLSLAAKFVYGPQILLWLLVIRPPRRLMLPLAVLVVLPSLPWWTKTWIATGNPLFPFGARIFGGYDWQPANQQVFDHYVRGVSEAGTATWNAVVYGGWFRAMKLQYLVLTMAIPGLLWFRRTRGLTLACIAGGMVTLMAGHQMRYTIPSTVLLSCLVAEETARWAGWRKVAGASLLAAYALARIALSPIVKDYLLEDAWRPLAAVHASRSGTYWEAVGHLRTRHPGRLISIGDVRLYPLPGRVIYGGYSGETPLIWKIAKSSANVEQVAKRFRQLGARHMLHNYVSVEWTEVPYLPFEWTDRDLRVYVEYCKRYLVPVWHSATADYVNGGFYLLEVRSSPLPHPPAMTWFAPGTESVYGAGTAHQMARRPQEALGGYLEGFRRLPDVGYSWNIVGHGYTAVNDLPNAYKYLSKFAEQGMMDALNLAEYAAALVGTGRTAKAERALADAWDKYPTHRHVIRVNQAALLGNKALIAVFARRFDEAVGYLDRAEAMLAEIPPGVDPGNAQGRRATAAFMIGLRGEVWLGRGNRERAAKCFRDSTQLDGTAKLAGRWRKLADDLAPRMF